jgi:hypothetical protein
MYQSRALILSAFLTCTAYGQNEVLIEGFEFASTDQAASAGVVDLTDLANTPAYYISGDLDNATEGQFSIGTDAAFCQLFCEAGSFIGFRRDVDAARFPDTCADGTPYAPLGFSYADPLHAEVAPPILALSELVLLCDAYGDGAFADGPTGTHFWVNLVDCEGEVYEFVNYSEDSLNSKIWTFNVHMGQGFLRLSPQSLLDVPDGDRLLTEIAAVEVLIQDVDNPPTTFGKWYIDNLRVIEPGGLQASAVGSRYLTVTPESDSQAVALHVSGDPNNLEISCQEFYVQSDGRLGTSATFLLPEEWGTVYVSDVGIIPNSAYLVRVDRGAVNTPELGPAMSVTTWVSGDADHSGDVTLDDVLCVLDAFAGHDSACSFAAMDMGPCSTDRMIDLHDIAEVLDAYSSTGFDCPALCDPTSCADGSIFLFTTLVGGSTTGDSDYSLEIDRERFRVNLFGAPSGTHAVRINGIDVGQLFVGGSGVGELEFDSNDGTMPPSFPPVGVHDVIDVVGVTGVLELACP